MTKRFKPETYEFRLVPMTIPLPHINYKIRVRILAPQEKDSKTLAFCRRENKHLSTLYLQRWCSPPTIAHELVHALQFICTDRLINFDAEQEHMGYIMQYAMGKILNMRYGK